MQYTINTTIRVSITTITVLVITGFNYTFDNKNSTINLSTTESVLTGTTIYNRTYFSPTLCTEHDRLKNWSELNSNKKDDNKHALFMATWGI